MKTVSKLLFQLPLVAVLVLASSFTLGGDKGEKISFYHTYDDFLKQKPTSSWDNYSPKGNYGFSALIDGKQTTGSFDDDDDWGYVDSKGFTWRLAKDQGVLCVICTGNVCMYVKNFYYLRFTGINETAKANYCADSRDGWQIYVSKGPNERPETCLTKLLKKYFADDADVLQKMKDNELHDYNGKKWLEDINNIISWVNEYNSKHK